MSQVTLFYLIILLIFDLIYVSLIRFGGVTENLFFDRSYTIFRIACHFIFHKIYEKYIGPTLIIFGHFENFLFQIEEH